jgi:hypothetical protein
VTPAARALLVASGVLAAAGGVTSAPAASLTLSEAETQEAVRVGTRSVTEQPFGVEWRVDNADGTSVVVLTPFHRVALAARQAAFRNEELRPADIARMLRDQRDRLVVLAEMIGPREDFALGLRPQLRNGDRLIKAAFVQNEHTPSPRDGGGFLARCVWTFPITELTGTARVSLIVQDRDARDVQTFAIDLGRMR